MSVRVELGSAREMNVPNAFNVHGPGTSGFLSDASRGSIVRRIYDGINLNRVTSGKNYSFISVAGS